MEDADPGGVFDVLAVAHENDLVEAEGGGCGGLAGVTGHGEDLTDVLDAVSAAERSDDVGRWLQLGRPVGDRVDEVGVLGGGDVVQAGVLGEGVAEGVGFVRLPV